MSRSSKSRVVFGRLWVVPIRMYRQVATAVGFQRNCLFRESCSVHVERITLDQGLIKGLDAARWRLSVCRPGYRFEIADGTWVLVLLDGSPIESEHVSAPLVAEAEMFLAAASFEIR